MDTGKPLRTREVHALLGERRELAYTTVMTVLDRLAKKGIVSRVRSDDRAWVYRPVQGRAELVAGALAEVLGAAGDDRAAALRLFVEGLGPDDRLAMTA